MNYQIVQLDEYEGSKATIYSVLPEDSNQTLFDKFIEEQDPQFNDEVVSILDLIEDINEKYGVRENLVKMNEGSPGDGIIALFDSTERNLRLYGIRFGMGIIILGSGGEKPKEVRALQEVDKLDEEVKVLKMISKELNKRIVSKEIVFSTNGNELMGNLIFSKNNEDE